jgi:hypothetical protein
VQDFFHPLYDWITCISQKKTERQTLAKDDPTTAASILRPVKRLGTYETILGSIDAYINEISRTPGIWGFLGNIGYQGQDAIFGAVYAHKGRTKKLQCHGLHLFARISLP